MSVLVGNIIRETRIYGKYRKREVWLTSETPDITWETVFSAQEVRSNPWASRWIYLYARRRVPLRHCLTVTVMLWESLPVSYYLSTSLARRILLLVSALSSTRLSHFFPHGLLSTLSVARPILSLRVKLCGKALARPAVSHIASFLFAFKESAGENASSICNDGSCLVQK